MKSQILHTVGCYTFWWGCRGNLTLITLGSDGFLEEVGQLSKVVGSIILKALILGLVTKVVACESCSKYKQKFHLGGSTKYAKSFPWEKLNMRLRLATYPSVTCGCFILQGLCMCGTRMHEGSSTNFRGMMALWMTQTSTPANLSVSNQLLFSGLSGDCWQQPQKF